MSADKKRDIDVIHLDFGEVLAWFHIMSFSPNRKDVDLMGGLDVWWMRNRLQDCIQRVMVNRPKHLTNAKLKLILTYCKLQL